VGKLVGWGIVVVAVAFVAFATGPDVARYLRMRRM
jgi:hypothetical protein